MSVITAMETWIRECGDVGGYRVQFKRVVRRDLSDKMTFQLRPEEGSGAGFANVEGNVFRQRKQ